MDGIRKLTFKKQGMTLLITFVVLLLVPQIAYGATVISTDTDISTLGMASGETLTVAASAPVRIYATDTSTVYDINIVCQADTDLEIENINVAASSGEALAFTGGTNTLIVSQTNTLSSGYTCPGIKIEGSSVLTIEGTGKCTATGGEFGAGIGGSQDASAGTINITSGTIYAIGGKYGAGIGGSEKGSGGRINISGGYVDAKGGLSAAGIGGGGVGSSGIISISGGEVHAQGNISGAGIGGGSMHQVERVTISGGKVYAKGSSAGAGIGGGSGNAASTVDLGGEIYITGGTVSATGGQNSAAIGSGHYAHAGSIIITGGDITARLSSNTYGAAIGSGNYGRADASGSAGTIRIDGGDIYAYGGAMGGAGIGGGHRSGVMDITINGGTVEATGRRAAGIGSGRYVMDGGEINITGGLVLTDTYYSGYNDIGCGQSSGTGIINISGDSALFLDDNTSSTVKTTTHMHLTDEAFVASGSSSTAYGYRLPSYWTGNAYAWIPISAVPTTTPTATPSATPTPTVSTSVVAPSPSASATPSASASVAPSASASVAPSASASVAPSASASVAPSASASATPSATPTPSTYLPPSPSTHLLPTPTPVPAPAPAKETSSSSTSRSTPTPSPAPSATPSPSAEATITPTPSPTPVSEVIDEELIPAGVEETQPTEPANRKAALAVMGSIGGAGLLVLLFYLLTNLTVKVGIITNGKVRQLTKKRWILKGAGEHKNQTVNFNISKAHQPKLVGVVVKKGLARKMRAGKVTVTINHKKYHEFDIPKDIDQRFAASKRFL